LNHRGAQTTDFSSWTKCRIGDFRSVAPDDVGISPIRSPDGSERSFDNRGSSGVTDFSSARRRHYHRGGNAADWPSCGLRRERWPVQSLLSNDAMITMGPAIIMAVDPITTADRMVLGTIIVPTKAI
jgi:hypothetical protein